GGGGGAGGAPAVARGGGAPAAAAGASALWSGPRPRLPLGATGVVACAAAVASIAALLLLTTKARPWPLIPIAAVFFADLATWRLTPRPARARRLLGPVLFGVAAAALAGAAIILASASGPPDRTRAYGCPMSLPPRRPLESADPQRPEPVWAALLAAARASRAGFDAGRGAFFALGADGGLREVPGDDPRALLAWTPGSGWTARHG